MKPFEEFWQELCDEAWTYLEGWGLDRTQDVGKYQQAEVEPVMMEMQKIAKSFGYKVEWNMGELSYHHDHPEYEDLKNHNYYTLFWVEYEGKPYHLWSNRGPLLDDACVWFMGSEFIEIQTPRFKKTDQSVIEDCHKLIDKDNLGIPKEFHEALRPFYARYEKAELSQTTQVVIHHSPSRRI